MKNPIQTARNFASRLFTAFGAPVAADNNVMTAGPPCFYRTSGPREARAL